VGVTFEVVRKAVEGALGGRELVDALKGRVGDPNPGAKRIDALFEGAFSRSFSEKAISTVESRAAKELFSAPIRDKLAQSIGVALFEEINEPWLPVMAARRALPKASVTPELVKGFVSRVDELERQLTSLMRGPRFDLATFVGAGFPRVQADLLTGYAKGLGRDALKLVLTDAIDRREALAWQSYISADLAARVWFADYQAVAAAYWETYDSLQAEMAEKARRLAEFQPVSSDYEVTISKTFLEPRSLEIGVSTTRTAFGQSLTIRLNDVESPVKLGPTRPSQVFGGHFAPPADGLLRLEVR
jgi:hypothetical protein